jgi:hypothetical protein
MKATGQKGGIVLAASLFLAAFAVPGETHADTATNLVCKGCVGKKDVGRNAVRGKAIRKNAVTSEKVKDGSIAATDLAEGAKPAGAVEGPVVTDVFLQATDAVINEVTIEAPTAGYVLAAANWFFYGSNSSATCGLSKGVAQETGHSMATGWEGTGGYTGSAIRFFEVSAGSNTINLVCRETAGNVLIQNTKATALFVPVAY